MIYVYTCIAKYTVEILVVGMVSVLAFSAIDHGFESRLGQTRLYNWFWLLLC